MSRCLENKVAIVTGAGSSPGEGIGNGKAAAVVYAREGASVMLVDLNPAAAEETKSMIEQEGGRSLVFQGNVAKFSDCQAMVTECLNVFGRVDILHNNVGVTQKIPGGPIDVDEEEWDRVMDTNLKSMYLTCRAVLPPMLKQRKGTILNISSIGAICSGYRTFIYTVSKAGVNALTRSLAIEYAAKGIRINAIMPGLIDTPLIIPMKTFHGNNLETMKRERNERVPMKRMGDGWDVAYASLFLVSDRANYITGQILAVDGGLSCKG